MQSNRIDVVVVGVRDDHGVELAGLTLHPLSLVYVASGSAMISTLRIPKI